MTGYFLDTIDLDPGAGTANFTSSGGEDIYILKLNSDGEYVWAKRIGGTSSELGYSLALDSSGNIYVTGYFYETVDFDPGPGTANLTSAGIEDIFILKLNSDGEYVWAKKVGGVSNDIGQFITLDSSSNIYITGVFSETTDFDPGAGTANLTLVGESDVFILKLNSDGEYVWAKGVGSSTGDSGYSIAVDSSGNSYTAGHFSETVDFDPGAGTTNLTPTASFDAFILKLDVNGDYVFAKKVGGAGEDAAKAITVDSSGNSYITGYFGGTVDFDPGAGTANLTASFQGIFVLKLNSSGDYVFAKSVGDTGNENVNAITLDGSGNPYIAGYFYDTLDFDPGAGTANLTSAGTDDAFVLKLDSSGEYVVAKKVGGTAGESASSLAVDSDGYIHMTGYFSETSDFDPGVGTANLTSAGSNDVYVLKLKGFFDTLTYNANSANNGIAPTDFSSPYLSGASVTVLGNTGSLNRTDYNFNGWNTLADGSGTNYDAGEVFTILTDTTLYAEWVSDTLDSSGGAIGFGIRFCKPEKGITTFCRWRDVNTTIASCQTPIYLVREVKYGAPNNPEDVKLLEKFLNTYENANLPVDGFYSLTDKNVVIRWQEKHYEDVLKPWGITKGTGYVYIKSLAKIKEIHEALCAGL
jgi:hypothetical protein